MVNTCKLHGFARRLVRWGVSRAEHHRRTISLIVEAIRAERLRLGWSKYRLANSSGVSLPAISLIEAGKREPNVLTLLLLADALGIRLGDIINRCDNQ